MEALTVNDLKRLCSERGLNAGRLRKQQIIELLKSNGLEELPENLVVRDTPRKSILTPSRSRRSVMATAEGTQSETPRSLRRRTKMESTDTDKENTPSTGTPIQRGKRSTRGKKAIEDPEEQEETSPSDNHMAAMKKDQASTDEEGRPSDESGDVRKSMSGEESPEQKEKIETPRRSSRRRSSPENRKSLAQDFIAEEDNEGVEESEQSSVKKPGSAKLNENQSKEKVVDHKDEDLKNEKDLSEDAQPKARRSLNLADLEQAGSEGQEPEQGQSETRDTDTSPKISHEPNSPERTHSVVEVEAPTVIDKERTSDNENSGNPEMIPQQNIPITPEASERKTSSLEEKVSASDEVQETPISAGEGSPSPDPKPSPPDQKTSKSLDPSSAAVQKSPVNSDKEVRTSGDSAPKTPPTEQSNESDTLNGLRRRTWLVNATAAIEFAHDEAPSPGASQRGSPEVNESTEASGDPKSPSTPVLKRQDTFVVETPSNVKSAPKGSKEAPRAQFRASKTPNFKKLHEREQARMESIVDHTSRKRERMRNLLKTTREIRERGSMARQESKTPLKTPLKSIKGLQTPLSSSKKILSSKVRSNRRFELLMKARGINVDEECNDVDDDVALNQENSAA